MPLVFCELALSYPPAKVSDPAERIAAANGQFLLVEREAYRRLGGHAAVSEKVLEDVELAFLAKRRKIRPALPLCRGRRLHAHVPLHGGDDRRLDKKPRATIRQLPGVGCLAADRYSAAGGVAVAGGGVLERAPLRSFGAMADRGLGLGAALGAQPLPFLWPCGKIQLFICELRDCAARVCRCSLCCSTVVGFSTAS
jgi:hypothetical protein